MNKKLIEQITDILVRDYGYDRKVSMDVENILEVLTETQITTYTFDDPEGSNFHYPDLDELILDLHMWDDDKQIPWAIYQQIEFREPILLVKFEDGEAIRVS